MCVFGGLGLGDAVASPPLAGWRRIVAVAVEGSRGAVLARLAQLLLVDVLEHARVCKVEQRRGADIDKIGDVMRRRSRGVLGSRLLGQSLPVVLGRLVHELLHLPPGLVQAGGGSGQLLGLVNEEAPLESPEVARREGLLEEECEAARDVPELSQDDAEAVGAGTRLLPQLLPEVLAYVHLKKEAKVAVDFLSCFLSSSDLPYMDTPRRDPLTAGWSRTGRGSPQSPRDCAGRSRPGPAGT